jgi:PAS domain S-box-containing protein
MQISAKLRQILDACAEMILLTDAQSKIVFANSALCQTSGFSLDELVGQSPKLLDSPNACRTTLKEMAQALRQGRSWSGRVLARRKGPKPLPPIEGQPLPKDPLEYWVEMTVSPIVDEAQTLLGYLQIQRDISAEVAEEARRHREAQDTKARLAIANALAAPLPLTERLRQVLEILFDLPDLDLQRKGGLFKRQGEELVLEFLHGQFSEEFREKERRIPLGACLCGRAAQAGELLVSDDCFCDPRHKHKFANMQAHGHYIVPLASQGQVLGVLFLYTDPYPAADEPRLAFLRQVGEMLALALLQEETRLALEAARNEALRSAQAKAAFLANMSHEIRTPMNGVLGMLELLKETPLSSDQRELLTTALHSAEALLDILNDILDFSKLEAGKLVLEHIPFHLGELLEDTVALFAQRAHAKGIELNLALPLNLVPQRVGDPTRLRQVLANLLGNAVKFTEQGEVTVEVTAHGEQVTVQVKDTGIGIPPEIQDKLFAPFTQADTSTTRRFGGTGLGLAISRQLVEAMGGWIGVQSAPGAGSTFTFTVPLPLAEDLSSLPPSTSPQLAGKRALIVDDNATNRKILVGYLQHLGLSCTEAEDGLKALAVITQEAPFDLIFLDGHMPQLDGIALAQSLRAIPKAASAKRVLLTSGKLLKEEERQQLELDAALSKPIRRSKLKELLSSWFAGPPSPREEDKSETANPAPFSPSARLLVVEDNPVNQKVIGKLLERLGLAFEFAANGQEALDKLKAQAFDLVLMDCQMPVLDGYQATRTWRTHERTHRLPPTPIVALTAHAGEGEREKCLSCGMDDYLAKPITRTALEQMLRRFLALKERLFDRRLALEQLDGDEELLQELLALFLDEAPKRLAALEAGRRLGEPDQVREAAHALKGMAAQIGAAGLKDQAASIERKAKAGEIDSAAIQSLAQTLSKLLASLQEEVHG